MLDLSDIDTPFPRTTSLTATLFLTKGETFRVSTNLTEEQFTNAFLNKRVKMTFYNRDDSARTRKIKKIKFDTPSQ